MSGFYATVRFADGAFEVSRGAPVEIGNLVVLFDGRIDESGVRASRPPRSGVSPDRDSPPGVTPGGSGRDGRTPAEAFAKWGDDAPAHLIGDFAIAVWDRAERHLVLARDRYGIRPLYFARDGETLIVTTDLAALDLSGELDDEAINDLLLFGYPLDLTKTSYARIGRVPPAHVAIFDRRGMRLRRYWEIKAVAARPHSERDAVEEFRHLFSQAVADRVRGADRVAISFSGGLDSTAVAATLAGIKPGIASAVTAGFEHLIADEDPHYARIAAGALGIPLHVLVSDNYALFERWDDPHCRGLEPVDTPLRAAFIDLMRLLGERGRVILTGQGGDAVLYASHGYFIDLLRRGRLDRVAGEGLRYALTRRRLPPLLFRSHLQRALHLRSDEPPYPRWMRADMRERWREFWSWRTRKLHPTRPEAAYFVQQAMWPSAFQSYDPAWTGVDAELAVPFFDVRVVEFLFSLPPMPYFADKDIVRRAMAGWLPDEVRLRRKSPLGTDPAQLLLARNVESWIPRLDPPALAKYVETRILTESLRLAVREERPMQQEISALSLAIWLAYR